MTRKKDLYSLHCRVEHLTAEKHKALTQELSISEGEMIDHIVEQYEKYCNDQDEILERSDLHNILSNLLEKVDRIEKKVGC